MSFSAGVFSINSAGQPVVTGTVISSTAFNALTADLATGLTTCVLKDGTQTITANIPMSSFKLTGLAAGSAAGNSVRFEQLLTFAADVAAHATTSDVWVAREVTLTGGAVTFTDIADAPAAGATVWVKQNAAHIWTDGAVFDVQGGANYTAAAGDWIRIYATTVSTFEVTIFRLDPSASATIEGLVELATDAEALAGSDTTRAVTSAGLASGKSLAAAGYMKLPGGLILQWNAVSIGNGTAVTFPITFPTACAQVIISDGASTAYSCSAGSLTTTGFAGWAKADTGAYNVTAARYLAIGY